MNDFAHGHAGTSRVEAMAGIHPLDMFGQKDLFCKLVLHAEICGGARL